MKSEILVQLEKIVVNVGIGRMSSQPQFAEKLLPAAMEELASITGQKAAPRPARQSIAGFKLREGAVVGLQTTLRGERMKAFFEKLVHIALPRVRDFRGLNPKSIDKSGNLTIGLKEHTVFSEVSPEHSKVNMGIQATVVPRRVRNHEEAIALYRKLGVPLKK